MSLSAGVIAPHPPILIPEIGGDYLASLSSTETALKKASTVLDELGAETIVIISPHSPLFRDSFIIRAEERFYADFDQFGVAEPRFTIDNDMKAVEAIVSTCRRSDIPLHDRLDPDGAGLDWGVSVPYRYLGKDRSIVSLSISTLSYKDHYSLGQAVAESLGVVKKRYVLVASGDLSHKLTHDAPGGYSPRGLEFDRLISQIIAEGRLTDLLSIDSDLIDSAGECGLRSFITLAGAFSKAKVEPKVLSYEGPFGVGYLVATILVKDGEPDV